METVQSPTRVTAKSDGNIFNDVTNIYHLISLMYFSFSFILTHYSWRELGRLEQWFSIFFLLRVTLKTFQQLKYFLLAPLVLNIDKILRVC